MTPIKQNSILVAICTLGENANLPVLVSQLNDFRSNSAHQIRIIIIWNSSKEVGIPIPLNVEIFHISARGYSNARNLALSQRKIDESVMFIDDDEIIEMQIDKCLPPVIDFLDIYLAAETEFTDSIFVGPYLPVDLRGDKLLADWKNFPDLGHGEVINFGSGGNLFLPASIFKDRKVFFDTFFNFGGEDTKLVRDLARNGIVTRWIPNAILYEKTPPERYTRKWQNERKLKNFLINLIIDLESNKFSWLRRNFYASKVLLVTRHGPDNTAGMHLTIGKKLSIFLAIARYDLQKLKIIAVNGDPRE